LIAAVYAAGPKAVLTAKTGSQKMSRKNLARTTRAKFAFMPI
jgi:hypothetical protein